MMNKERILKLFENFAGDEIDLHGLKCIPVNIGEEVISKKHNKPYYQIEFEIENPNYIADDENWTEKYRYKLDLIDEGWLTYITKKIDGKDLKNLYLP